jgi:hypothetical protein
MAKFDLATNTNMKIFVFNLAVMLRRSDAVVRKAATELERISRDGNTRDIDTSEIANALAMTETATNYLDYIKNTAKSAMAENDRIGGVNKAVAAVDELADLFCKLSLK